MPTHITARLAWHNDGWDGSVCRQPERNTYCVGWKSFPGDVIARERDLAVEQKCAGCRGAELKGYIPPCSYSYNAFGLEPAQAASNPPDFFFGGAQRHEWELPPATVCVWPYEAMYGEDVSASGYMDNDLRRQRTLEFFQPVQADCGHNLIFYYANYSNPLSDDDAPRYVILGVSRISAVGPELKYEEVSSDVAKRYAGGMIWARNVSSAYPEEGLRLPYHLYQSDPERLAQMALYPENPVLFKYGSRHLSDDEAIGLLEQFLDKVRFLIEIDDQSEDWHIRERWLLSTIAELWKSRGLYPGLLRALEAAGAEPLIDAAKSHAAASGSQAAHAAAFKVLETGQSSELTRHLGGKELEKISRNWRLLPDDVRVLLRDVLPRFDLSAKVMSSIISERRDKVGILAAPVQVCENPYVLAESYSGENKEDRIPWSVIDRGVIASPEVGGRPLAEMELNDRRRFRALCVDHLRREPNHTFRLAPELLDEIAIRMERLPAWKQAQFSTRHFDVDADFLADALTLKSSDEQLLVYLRALYEDERLVEAVLRDLADRPDLDLRRPIDEADWLSWTFKSESPLARQAADEYRAAVEEQASVCARLFRRPLSVVTGPAGTGKTTVIEALIRATRRTEGEGASILVLAPTGKATDRAREVFENAALSRVETATVHSFLASSGWLNENLTFKRYGGKRKAVGTLVLDEASMLDVELAAALFRAIDWQAVRRLILVGDAGQLPPIGRGRLFADVIGWMTHEAASGLGRLQRNLRQLTNQIEGRGSAIVRLAELFIVDDEDKSFEGGDRSTRPDQEALLAKVHAGGRVDEDLDVVYWDNPAELSQLLISKIEAEMSANGASGDAPHEIWRSALQEDPTAYQVLTPHRGELHGVEALNEACQARRCTRLLNTIGSVEGITLTDKVIQVRNRPASDMIWAYDFGLRKNVKVEVFNGEIGNAEAMAFDRNSLWGTVKSGRGKRLRRFSVRFKRKPNLAVGYGKDVPTPGRPVFERVEENLELAYAVSVHKAQGSEFLHTFIIIPASRARPVSTELTYTALTRATRHCTLLLEGDVTSLLDARRRENAQTPQVNSSLFRLHVAKAALRNRRGWYEAGKIHEALSGDMLRSKSEVIIANLLHEREIPFLYEQLLRAPDGTMRLPDFTLSWRGRTYYWEHLGLLDQTTYAAEWEAKRGWYTRWFPGQLITTAEGPHLSRTASDLIVQLVRGDLELAALA